MGANALMVLTLPAGVPLALEQVPRLEQIIRRSIEDDGIDLCAQTVTSLYEERGWKLDPLPGCHWAIHVNLDGRRYYGPGYERGDARFMVAIAEALESSVPGSLPYYGDDYSDTLGPFGPAERAALIAHLEGPHGDDYHNSFAKYRPGPA